MEWVKLAHETNVPKNSLGIPVDFIRLAKLLSVPLVCLLFTWFHVWLALQMMFFPIDPRAVQSSFEFPPLHPKSKKELLSDRIILLCNGNDSNGGNQDFVGFPSRPIVPSWFGLPINGWQGIVPRKAEVMARRACDRMIGNIVTIEEFMDRFPDSFIPTFLVYLRKG